MRDESLKCMDEDSACPPARLGSNPNSHRMSRIAAPCVVACNDAIILLYLARGVRR